MMNRKPAVRVDFSSMMGLALMVIAVSAAGCDGRGAPIDVTAPSAVVSGLEAKPGTSAETPVTTTIANTDNGYALRVGSDGAGSYVNTKSIQSLIQGTTGDWTLTTYTTPPRGGGGFTGSNRTVFFDLTEPVSPGNPAPPFQTASVQAHLIAKCHLAGVGLLNIATGSTVACPGAFRFQAPNGLSYRLGFQPDNYPEVNRMNVTCLAADSGGCKQWTITPEGTTTTGGDPNPKNVNKLLRINPTSDEVLEELGDYFLSFHITLVR